MSAFRARTSVRALWHAFCCARARARTFRHIPKFTPAFSCALRTGWGPPTPRCRFPFKAAALGGRSVGWGRSRAALPLQSASGEGGGSDVSLGGSAVARGCRDGGAEGEAGHAAAGRLRPYRLQAAPPAPRPLRLGRGAPGNPLGAAGRGAAGARAAPGAPNAPPAGYSLFALGVGSLLLGYYTIIKWNRERRCTAGPSRFLRAFPGPPLALTSRSLPLPGTSPPIPPIPPFP